MTKVSVFGQPTEQKELKPIEFVYTIDYKGDKVKASYNPNEYPEVMLYRRGDPYDIILAFYKEHTRDIILGHWNDGLVK